ncbi:hypothetical protein P6144_01015 [Sphingomonas sp. HITSZ_GF]|uniref:hypothetical protein n=1 Tax=Sphingomonas sp. HITSZ_GF TaxID=3037247 RepID=UPI00240DFD2E|nr:hypothetical protein [Sphingomonas sp. HITSZ_GF]MDG2532214.1 hypothetical protein [Sphingomonas sp. HITSZ_GF]
MNVKIMTALSCLAGMAVASCGNAAAPTAKTEAPPKPETGALPTASPAHAAPQTDKWAGEYEFQPSQDEMVMGITPLGGSRYKVAVSWGGGTSGGMYNVAGWEGTAEAKGDVLAIRIEGGSDVVTCSLRYVAGVPAPYNMVGCGGGDGPYRRARAGKAVSASAPVGRWAVPDGSANKIGIKASADASEFSSLLLNCESGQIVVTALVNRDSQPSPARLSISVDGKTIVVPVKPEEDDFNGVWNLSGAIPNAHPLLAALPTARAIVMDAADTKTPLPVAGLAASWKSFARACRLS